MEQPKDLLEIKAYLEGLGFQAYGDWEWEYEHNGRRGLYSISVQADSDFVRVWEDYRLRGSDKASSARVFSCPLSFDAFVAMFEASGLYTHIKPRDTKATKPITLRDYLLLMERVFKDVKLLPSDANLFRTAKHALAGQSEVALYVLETTDQDNEAASTFVHLLNVEESTGEALVMDIFTMKMYDVPFTSLDMVKLAADETLHIGVPARFLPKQNRK